MVKDRELVKLLLQDIENSRQSSLNVGLLFTAKNFMQWRIVNFKEYQRLLSIIEKIKPKKLFKDTPYYWDPFDYSSRIKALESLAFNVHGDLIG